MVEFQPDATITFITLGEMEEALETLVGRKVDVISKRGLHPRLRQPIRDSARVLYAA